MTIPVTIVSGFLGAGKTTFINHILKHTSIDPQKILVLVNEVGDISIDHQLIIQDSSRIYQLASGCMCCSLQGDLIQTLIDIDYQVQNKTLNIDYIIIECTGIADPLPVAQAVNSALIDHLAFYVDAIFTLVDSLNYQENLKHSPIIKQQIIGADRIYLSKGCDPADIETIKTYNPMVQVTCLDLDSAHTSDHFFHQKLHGQFNHLGLQAENNHNHYAAHHHHGVDTISLSSPQILRLDYFQSFIDWLMASFGENLYRFKGIIHFKDQVQAVALQGVQGDYYFQDLAYDHQGPSQLVIIGQKMNAPNIQAVWQDLILLSQSDRPY